MKSLLRVWLACSFCLLMAAPEARAQVQDVPRKINVQGVLRNVAGEVVSGSYTVNFTIYSAQTGGTILYGPEPQYLTVTGGVFSTYIGPVPPETFVNRSEAWLGIRVGSDAELPRQQIGSVGFSYQAQHAEEADVLLGAASDVACTGCVDGTDVAFNYAGSASKGGPASDLACTACVAGSEIGSATITATNIASNAVTTVKIADGAVTNAKLGADAVTSAKIQDGQVMTVDLADGAVTSAKMAAGAVGATQLGVSWALGVSAGGDAAGLTCTGCVDQNEVSFNYAASNAKGGAATNVDCTASPCIADTEITFNYAGSASKGGAASNLACTDCVDQNEVQFNYAGSTSEGGPAIDVACTGCVGDTDLGVNYAGSASKGGPASDLACTGCVASSEVSFNWAMGTGPGGAATGVSCTGCVNSTAILDGTILNADISATANIDGSKVVAATTSARGTVQVGTGLSVDGSGLLTVNFGTAAGTVAAGNHTHTEYYMNNSSSNDLMLYPGKRFYIYDDGADAAASPYMVQAGAGTANLQRVRMGFPVGGTTAYFEVWSESPALQAHVLRADGYAKHAGNLEVGGQVTCTGCVGSAAIADGSVSSADIADGTIAGGDLASNISITTSGNVTGGNAYFNAYYDRQDNNYYADPNGTSRMLQITYDRLAASARPYPTANWMGLDNGNAYLDTLNTDTDGTPLNINYYRCGNVEYFTGNCAAGSYEVNINGAERAKIWYDRDNAGYYMDPSATSNFYAVYTRGADGNTTHLPYTNGYNYLRGNTYFNGVLYDEGNSAYYLDPASNSRVNLMYANGLRLYNAYPGDASGFAQVANGSGHLYLAPDSAASQYVIMRYGSDDRIYFMLNGGIDTARPSFRTNGNYLVINPGTNDKNIYLLWDTGGNVQINGALYADIMYDRNGSGCVSDPSGTTATSSVYGNLGFFNQFRADQIYAANNVLVGDAAGDTWSYRMYRGLVVNNGNGIRPVSDNNSFVGLPMKRFYASWIINQYGASHRHLKREITYLTDDQIRNLGDMVMSLKPATFYYNSDAKPEEVNEDNSGNVRYVPHIGMILDEMPPVLTNGGHDWSITDSVGFLLSTAKYFEMQNREKDQRIRDLEDRVAVLEQVLVDAGLLK